MLSTIFGILATLLGLLVLWFIVVSILSVCGAIIKITLESPIFWAAIIGGLLVYLFGGRSNSSILWGMIVGGGVMLLGYLISYFGFRGIFKVILCTLAGVFIGSLCGFSILLGIVGLVIGIIWK